MHWACKECIVRACCEEDCYKIKLYHSLCEDCKENTHCKAKCEPVLLSERIRRLDKLYDLSSVVERYFQGTNIFYNFF